MTQSQAMSLLKMGKNVYLTGQAGSGKTYVLNYYVDFLKSHRIPVAVTASTGIAATHLNGTTIHSWSGIGIKSQLTDFDLNRIADTPGLAAKIQSAKVLIIDEISMLHSYRVDMVNQVCKYLRLNPQPFGGLQIVLCGDFFQLPPINETGMPSSGFAFKSKAWAESDLSICYLTEQHRQDDESFLQLLNTIRSQEVDDYVFEKLSGRMHVSLSSKTPTRLYSHNIDVDAVNVAQLEKISQPENIFLMTSQGKKPLVETLKKGCLAPPRLVLKKGALVMFIKNNPPKGYMNGTLGKVIGFDEENFPIVETYSGKKIIADSVSWELAENDKVLAQITQVPLRLAWAITVHKSQGMSLDAAEIDLSKSFAYGMGYVALSRVKTLDGIKLLGLNPMALQVDSEIAGLDIELKKLSARVSLSLSQISPKSLQKIQSDFLTKITASNSSDQF